MVSKMLKFHAMKTSRLMAAVLATAVCLPLAGCLNPDDPWDEGSLAYTVDEVHPIGAREQCGQEWPDLGHDASNHLSPNHGCAVHANITAMIADPSVIKKPKRRPRTTAAVTATAAINNLLVNAASSTATSNGTTGVAGSTP
jgi:type IV pilus biogenesis protein CpaD/CtpE